MNFLSKHVLALAKIIRFVILIKIVSIFLLSIYLLADTQFSELAKMPILIEHYQAHKQADHQLSFMGFLVEHYLHDSTSDPDYNSDMKLPFKTPSNHVCFSINFYVPNNSYTVTKQVFSVPKKIFIAKNINLISSSFLSSIWQPPKFC